MGFEGLDPQAVRHTADTLARQAAALDKVVRDVDALIRTVMHHWFGPEAQDFHQWWAGQHRPRLQSAAQGMHGAAAGVRQQVAEQERASGGTGPASGFGSVAMFLESGFHAAMGTMKREGPIGSISVWDVVTDGFKAADLAGHKVPFVSDAFLGIDTLDVVDRTARGEASIGDWFHTAGDWTTRAGEASKLPVVGLVGLNINVWTQVAEEATKVDWSPGALTDTAAYAITHPADVVDVFADSTLEVGKRLFSWL